MKIRITASLLVAAVMAIGGYWALAQVTDVEIDKLPPKVAAAIKAKWPKAKISHAAKQKEKDTTFFNLSLEEGSGKKQKKWGATLTPDGKIDEIQEPVDIDDVPKPVLAALGKKYPLVKKAKVDKISEGDGSSGKAMYEFRFMIQSRFDSAGKTIDEVEIELDEKEE